MGVGNTLKIRKLNSLRSNAKKKFKKFLIVKLSKAERWNVHDLKKFQSCWR